MDKIAVLIPCYNESATIEKVVTDFKAAIPNARIFVYDNNSTDGTDEIARKAGAEVRYEYQQGKGNVVRRMFQEIEAECYILTDGDDTYPADAATEMVALVLDKKADMVIGDRLSSTYFSENKRLFHNTGNRLVRDTINTIFNSNIHDIMTGYRAFSYRFVKTFPVLRGGFEIETEMTIHAIATKMNIRNVVVNYTDRPKGSQSKLRTVPDGMKVLMTIFNLFRDYKPFSFFSWIAFILFMIGMIFFVIYVAIPFSQTGLVEHFPTLFLCGVIWLAAIFSFFSGMILDAIMNKEKREFEFRLNLIEIMQEKSNDCSQ